MSDKYGMRYWEIMNESMAQRAVAEAPIAATPKFKCFHGNYCGPGNRGGKPIDELDRACFKHDCEYDRSYKEDEATARARQIKADKHFIERALKVAANKATPKLVRLKAYAAAKYFMKRLRQHTDTPPAI